jgi:acyl-CoA reductase-like NAD-dependent aldehyde dehydrogenase
MNPATLTTEPTFDVVGPADGTTVATLPDLGAEAVAATVARLRDAQPAWEASGVQARAMWLGRFRDWILDNEDRLADLLQQETGKSRQDAAFEPLTAVDMINYYAANAEKFLSDEHPRPHGLLTASKALTIVHRPHPVVGVICPWNFPILIALFDAVPALLAGAAVAVKPSEFTPLTAVELARAWKQIGAPPVFEVLTGTGATGAALVDDVDYVQFTGSTRTGRRIAQRAAERLIPYSLELGGKDAMIVLADADLDRAVNAAAWGGLFNSGQACVSVERVYVEAPVYEEFVGRLADRVKALRHGPDDDSYYTDVGAMANEQQVALVERHVADALKRGARVVTGGSRVTGPGTFYEPTVLADVDHSMICMRDETFGPTIPVMPVADADEAVALANDSVYGLSATVWTRDAALAQQIARRLDVGAVNINDMYANVFTYPVPHSGWKESGIGARLGGSYGMLKYCRSQSITVARVTPKAELLWYPYSPRKSRFAGRLLRLLVARDWHRRVRRSQRS